MNPKDYFKWVKSWSLIYLDDLKKQVTKLLSFEENYFEKYYICFKKINSKVNRERILEKREQQIDEAEINLRKLKWP